VALANKGTLGASANKTDATSIAHTTTTTAVAAGDLVIVVVAKDNAAATNGNTNEITSVTDSAGNTYTKIREYCNSRGAANGGATVAAYYSLASFALGIGGTITANFSDTRAAKALSAWAFTATGDSLTIEAGAQDSAVTGGDAGGALTISSLPSGEHLFLRATAIEVTFSTGQGAGTNYTALTNAGTAVAGSASNMQVAGEWRILAATGDTSDPATFSPFDAASFYVAVTEASSSNRSATLAQTLGAFTLAAAMTLSGPNAALASTLAPVTLVAPATVSSSAVLGATLDAVTCSATATVGAGATQGGYRSLSAYWLGGASSVPPAGSTRSATLDATLEPVTLNGAATSSISAAVDKTLGAITCNAASTVSSSAALSQTLDPVTCVGTATVISGRVAALDATLEPVTCVAAATSSVSAALNTTLGPVTSTAAATLASRAVLTKTLGPVTCSAAATSTVSATLSKGLGSVTCSATAVRLLPRSAVLSVTLDAITLTATIEHEAAEVPPTPFTWQQYRPRRNWRRDTKGY
jgi:hypothetical protein